MNCQNYIILLLSIIVISFSCDNSRKLILDRDIKGTIINIYQDRNNHEVFTFSVKNNNNEQTFIADFYPNSWKYACIGDSIIKNRGESYITIKKNNGFFKIFETRIK